MVAREMISIAILGDVHGNARALRAALEKARSGPLDALVFVGDLLTYGHDVDEVIELVAEAQLRDRATLLIGNHDQMYFEDTEDPAHPAWIRESIALTRSRLGGRKLRDELNWSTSFFDGDLLVEHANPFGDMRYLTDDSDAAAAADAVRDRGAKIGVFGHTHRPRWCGCSPACEPALDEDLTASFDRPVIANAGSVGQPRDARARSMILRLAIDKRSVTARFETVDYDVQAHLAGLRASALSAITIERLSKFFVAPGR